MEINANKGEYVQSDLCYEVVGCATAVINALGQGLGEKTCERALCVAFDSRGLGWKKIVLQKGRKSKETESVLFKFGSVNVHLWCEPTR